MSGGGYSVPGVPGGVSALPYGPRVSGPAGRLMDPNAALAPGVPPPVAAPVIDPVYGSPNVGSANEPGAPPRIADTTAQDAADLGLAPPAPPLAPSGMSHTSGPNPVTSATVVDRMPTQQRAGAGGFIPPPKPGAAPAAAAPAAYMPGPGDYTRPAGGPARTIAAHEEARGRTEQREEGLDLARVRTALDDQHDAQQKRAFADETIARNLEYVNQEKAAKLQDMARKQAEEDAAIKAERDKQRAKLNAEVDSAKVDPANALPGGAFGTIAAAIAMGIGAYASVVGGGPNTAMQVINQTIDRNVESQREALAKSKEKRAQVIAEWGSEDEYLQAQRVKATSAAMAQLDSMAANLNMDEAQTSRVQGLRGQLAGGIAADELSYAEKTQARVVNSRTFQQVAEQRIGGGGGQSRLTEEAKARMAFDLQKAHPEWKPEQVAAVVSQADRGGTGMGLYAANLGTGGQPTDESRKDEQQMAARFVPEAGGYARDAEQARKLRAAAESRANLQRNYADIQRLRESYTNRASPDARARLDALVADNTIQWKNLGELGVLSADDRELIAPLTGQGSLDLWSPGADARLTAAQGIVEQRWRTALSNSGVTPGAESMGRRGVRGDVTGVASTPAAERAAASSASEGFTPAGGRR